MMVDANTLVHKSGDPERLGRLEEAVQNQEGVMVSFEKVERIRM